MTDPQPNAPGPKNTGLYTTSEVEQRTGVPATTLRQWERRYGLPRPVRNANGYRLYSALDLATIEFLQARLAEGISISRAVELCREQLLAASSESGTGSETATRSGSPITTLREQLTAALLAPDMGRAGQLLSQAHAQWTVEDVLLNVVQPSLYDIGERWARGEITVAHEHQASAFLRGRISQLLELAGTDGWGPTVVVACAPGEQHELGVLMLSVVLRRAGVRAHYLGANLPLGDMLVYAREVGAEALLLGANLPEALPTLRESLATHPTLDLPLFLGGAVFNRSPQLARELGGQYLGPDAVQAARHLVTYFKEKHAQP